MPLQFSFYLEEEQLFMLKWICSFLVYWEALILGIGGSGSAARRSGQKVKRRVRALSSTITGPKRSNLSAGPAGGTILTPYVQHGADRPPQSPTTNRQTTQPSHKSLKSRRYAAYASCRYLARCVAFRSYRTGLVRLVEVRAMCSMAAVQPRPGQRGSTP